MSRGFWVREIHRTKGGALYVDGVEAAQLVLAWLVVLIVVGVSAALFIASQR